MKKKAFLKLMEKYPGDAEIVFKTSSNSYYSARVEVEKNYDVFETEYDEEKEIDKPLKTPKVEEARFVRLVIE